MTLPRGLGFGCYRVAENVQGHHAALWEAWVGGCRLFDTASNYMSGSSEKLLGQVFESLGEDSGITMWTKAGYVGSELRQRLDGYDITQLSAETGYSLAPQVIRKSLELSLERLRRHKIAGLMLHNPENMYKIGESEPNVRLKEAMACCEELVNDGLIEYYGISSGQFRGANECARDTFEVRSLLEIADEVSSNNHLMMLQMPFNLVERGAAIGTNDSLSLVKYAKAAGVHLVANRPLNAFRDGLPLRLAEYSAWQNLAENWSTTWKNFYGMVEKQLATVSSDLTPYSFPVVRMLRDASDDLPHPDLVDEIFAGRVRPFIDALFEGSPTSEGIDSFNAFYTSVRVCSQRRLTAQAFEYRHQFEGDPDVNAKPLALIAVEYPLQMGFDCVLVGMRSVEYVNMMKPLLAGPLDR